MIRIVSFALLLLIACTKSGDDSNLGDQISFQNSIAIQAPAGMTLSDERQGPSPYQVYYSEDKELELQFKLLAKFASTLPELQGIYDKNAEDNDIKIIESSIKQINGAPFIIHRTEGINDYMNYHTIQLVAIHKNRIALCLVRTLTKNKEKWAETMEKMASSIQLL